MKVISKDAVDEIISGDSEIEAVAVFSFESPFGRKVWDVCESWDEADQVAVKGGARKVWEKLDRPGRDRSKDLLESLSETPIYQPKPADFEDVEDDLGNALKAAADREWSSFRSSGILKGQGVNKPLYGWSYLRPQVQAWSVMLENKMREASEKLAHLSDVDVDVLMAWIESEMVSLKEAFDESKDEALGTRAMDVSLNCVLLTDRVMKNLYGEK